MEPDIRKCRRVITGLGTDGRSKAVLDGPSPHTREALGYIDFVEEWVTPSPPPMAGEELKDAAEDAPDGLEPDDPRGTLLRTSIYQPDPPDFDSRHAMHSSKTVDYAFVLAGEMVCVFEDGEVTLRPGDVVVQRGTRHAWSNRTDKPAMIGFVMVGAPDHGTEDTE
jgi:mannose-6-phosphate isomerase-like protein (cupin superfamily)